MSCEKYFENIFALVVLFHTNYIFGDINKLYDISLPCFSHLDR